MMTEKQRGRQIMDGAQKWSGWDITEEKRDEGRRHLRNITKSIGMIVI